MAKIFLIGYMGSGKTTIGKKLAKTLHYSFTDLDEYIETEYGHSIADIFAIKGEAEFRAIEHNSLKKLLQFTNTVIACGGGTPCYFNNMELMNRSGITIYLKMSVKSLVERLLKENNKRPLIAGKAEPELHAFITQQLEKREDFYQQAQFTIKGKNLRLNTLASFIKETIIM